jgi:hypothetical protein
VVSSEQQRIAHQQGGDAPATMGSPTTWCWNTGLATVPPPEALYTAMGSRYLHTTTTATAVIGNVDTSTR